PVPIAPPAPVAPPAPIAPPPRTVPIAPSIAVSPSIPPAPPLAPPSSTRVRLASTSGPSEPTASNRPGLAPAARRRGHRARLGELLVAEGIISQEQLHEALREHRRSKERLRAVPPRRGPRTEERLVDLLSREHGLPAVDVRNQTIPPDILVLVPAHLARKHEVLPLSRADGALTVAMSDPTNVVAMDEIAATTRLSVLPVIAGFAAIR